MAREFVHQLGLPDQPKPDQPDISTLADRFSNFSLKDMYPKDVENNISILALMAKHPFIQFLFDSLRFRDYQRWTKSFGWRTYMAFGDEGRQFIVTANGFMGLGQVNPPVGYDDKNMIFHREGRAREGDVIAVLAGSDKVWILRSTGSSAYRIVGHGYVYGLTEGMCFRHPLPPMQDLEIQ